MKAMAVFAGVSFALLAGLAWLGTHLVRGADAAHAIWLSAVIAFTVQLFTFAIVRLVSRDNVWTAWGLGTLMRFVVLALYGVVVLKMLALPLAVALISLVAFFFVSTLVEPLLLTI